MELAEAVGFHPMTVRNWIAHFRRREFRLVRIADWVHTTAGWTPKYEWCITKLKDKERPV